MSDLMSAATLFLVIMRPAKRILPIVIALMILSAACGEWVAVSHAQAIDPIQSIRLQYAAINKRTSRLRRVKKQLSGYSLEEGDLIAYFDGPAILKLVANHYGEGGKTVEEYYYSKGNLIFVFERVFYYDQPMSGKVVRTVENRFYFHNDKLIRWIDENGKQAPSEAQEYEQKENEYFEHSTRFLNGARSKSQSIEAPN